MNKPLTLEEAQARIHELEQQVAKNSGKKERPIELLVEYETGNLQIRRLTPKSLNLPTFVIRWILANAQEILKFMSTNKHLLAEQGDEPQIEASKASARGNNLTSEKPVVRKPRAKNGEPATEF